MLTPGYIQRADFGTLGIPDATEAQVAHASQLANTYIGKPRGLLWSPDTNGAPAWQTLATPSRVIKAADALTPGTSVVVHLAYGTFGQGDVGTAVVLDRRNVPETCTIVAASGNTITFDAIQFAHAANATVEFGLTLNEEVSVVYGGMFRLASRPVARVLGVTGSYSGNGSIADRLLAIGREGDAWNAFPLGQCDLDEAQGSAWMLPGAVAGGFSRVRVGYVAGWSDDALPFALRQATANIVRNALDSEMGGNLKMVKTGNAAVERFSASMIDPDTAALLAPYRNARL